MNIHYSYKRDSEESHDDFFKSVSHNICITNFRPMIDAVFRMTAHDIWTNSAHNPVCEYLMDAHDIYANSAHGICVNSKWLLMRLCK